MIVSDTTLMQRPIDVKIYATLMQRAIGFVVAIFSFLWLRQTSCTNQSTLSFFRCLFVILSFIVLFDAGLINNHQKCTYFIIQYM